MPRPKGTPKTGGRKPGSQNKAKRQEAIAIAQSGLTPLDYLVSVMRDEAMPLERRMDAAKSAAPYVHPRLASIEHGSDPDSPMQMVQKVEFVVVD
jgi:hypothetical protein